MFNLTFSITLGVFHGPPAPLSPFATCSSPWKAARCTAPQALLTSDFSLGLANGEPGQKMGRKEESGTGIFTSRLPPRGVTAGCCVSPLGVTAPSKCSSPCVSPWFWLLVTRPSPHPFRPERSAPLLLILGHCSTLWVFLHTALLLKSPLTKVSSNYPI